MRQNRFPSSPFVRFTARAGHILTVALALVGPALLALNAARASAPAGQYTVSTSTVVDNKTRLTWYRTIGTNMNLTAANNYCGVLGVSWRLATVKELQTLIDDSQPSPPRLDASAFPGAPSSGFYISSTTFATDSTSNWYVNFNSGNTGYQPGAAPSNVLCVRTGT